MVVNDANLVGSAIPATSSPLALSIAEDIPPLVICKRKKNVDLLLLTLWLVICCLCLGWERFQLVLVNAFLVVWVALLMKRFDCGNYKLSSDGFEMFAGQNPNGKSVLPWFGFG